MFRYLSDEQLVVVQWDDKPESIVVRLSVPLFVGLVLITSFLLLSLIQVLWGGSRGRLSGSSKKRTIMLLGACNAGKTAMFHRLRDGTFVSTVTSMKEKSESFKPAQSEKIMNILDYPGHQRMRIRAQDFFPLAAAIVVVVDSADKGTIRSTAELMYDLFTHPKINDGGVPTLIACNKSDVERCASANEIKVLLEKELSQLKQTRASLEIEGMDEDDAAVGNHGGIPLGREGQNFVFAYDAPCPVSFEACSVKNNDLEKIVAFMEDALA